ncbi:MAG: hypothetical protein Q9219_007583, partial [cf. Caloplaca sp. 3 TL-2023]
MAGVLSQVKYSGVWLDDRFFLICAHSLPRSSSRSPLKEAVQQLSVDENPWGYIFSGECFEDLVDIHHYRSRGVRLWEFNEENDIAIFRVSIQAKRKLGPPGIGYNTISSDQSDNQEADIPVFTIAYSNNDELFVEDSEFSKERRSQNPEFHEKIASSTNHFRPQATATEFRVIFLPNERALAAGRLIPSSADILIVTGAMALEDERSLTREEFHTISTYFGCLGGPVVSVKTRDDKAAAAKVIGL